MIIQRRPRSIDRRFLAALLGAAFLIALLPSIADLRLAGQFVADLGVSWLTTRPAPPRVRRLVIDMKYEHLQRLRYERQRRLEGGVRDHHYVPARIEAGGDTVRARLRLKGDRILHLSDPKAWSFRVRVGGGGTVYGMRSFSLHRPGMRNYLHEWFFHRVLAHEGLPALRYEFVEVFLRGERLGIYALEEHFDKHLLEAQGLREGPIVRFDESVDAADLSRSIASAFREDDWLELGRREVLESALGLLEAYRRRELALAEVFDVGRLARFFAILDVLGTRHAGAWKSTRFYYNPILARLVPIGFDGHHGGPDRTTRLVAEIPHHPETGWLHSEYGPWFRLLFSDPETFDPDFFVAYVKELERMSDPAWLAEIENRLRGEIDANTRILELDAPLLADHVFHMGPDRYRFDLGEYAARQQSIRKGLRPAGAVHAVRSPDHDGFTLIQIGNIHSLPIEITALAVGEETWSPEQSPIVLPAKDPRPDPWNVSVYRPVRFAVPSLAGGGGPDLSQARIRYRVLGAREELEAEVRSVRARGADGLLQDLLRRRPTVERHAAVVCDELARRCRIERGRWELDQHLVMPEGWTLAIGPGADIDLVDGSSILVRGPVDWRGSEGAPIQIHSSDGSGGGVIVLVAGSASTVEWVRFAELTAPRVPGLTGAVTFYESPVAMTQVAFRRIQAEDALNVIRTEIVLRDCEFEETASDAIDVDFGEAELERCRFRAIGNDALDISGTTARVTQLRVESAGDKAVSVGEASRLDGEDFVLRNVGIGVASKDQSAVEIHGLRVSASEVALAGFQKKSEFGPASLDVRGFETSDVPTPYLLERGSSLTLEGKTFAANRTRVKEELYGESPKGSAR